MGMIRGRSRSGGNGAGRIVKGERRDLVIALTTLSGGLGGGNIGVLGDLGLVTRSHGDIVWSYRCLGI